MPEQGKKSCDILWYSLFALVNEIYSSSRELWFCNVLRTLNKSVLQSALFERSTTFQRITQIRRPPNKYSISSKRFFFCNEYSYFSYFFVTFPWKFLYRTFIYNPQFNRFNSYTVSDTNSAGVSCRVNVVTSKIGTAIFWGRVFTKGFPRH